MKILHALINRKLNSQMTCSSYNDFLTFSESLNCRNTRCNPNRVKYFDVDDNAREWYAGNRALPVEDRPMFSSRYRPSTGNALQRGINGVSCSPPGRRVSPEFLNLLEQYESRMPGLEQQPSQFRRLSFSYYKYDAEGKRRHMRPGIDTAAPLEFSTPIDKKYLELLLRGQRMVTGPQAPLKTEPRPSGSSSSKSRRKQKRVVQRTRDKGNQERNRRSKGTSHMGKKEDPKPSRHCPLLPSPNCNNKCNQEQYWDPEGSANADNFEGMEQKNRKEEDQSPNTYEKNKSSKVDGLQLKMEATNQSIAKLQQVVNSNLPVPLFCEPRLPISWCPQDTFTPTEKLAEYEKRLRRIVPACSYGGNKCTALRRSLQFISDCNNNTNITGNCKQKVLDGSSSKDHLVIKAPHNSVISCTPRQLRLVCSRELRKISCIRGPDIPPKKKVRLNWPCVGKKCSEKNPKFYNGTETNPSATEKDTSRLSESEKENGTQTCRRPSIGCHIPYEIKIPSSCIRSSCTQTFHEEKPSKKEQGTQHFQIQTSSIGCNCPDEAKIRSSCTQTGFDLGNADNPPSCLNCNQTTQTACQRDNCNERKVGTDDRCPKPTDEEPPPQLSKKPRLLPRLRAFTKRLLNSGQQLEKDTSQTRMVEIPIRCDGQCDCDAKQRETSTCDNQDPSQAQAMKNSCGPENCQYLKVKSSAVFKTISPYPTRHNPNSRNHFNTPVSSGKERAGYKGSTGAGRNTINRTKTPQTYQQPCSGSTCRFLKTQTEGHGHKGSTGAGRNTINRTKTPQTNEQPCSGSTCRLLKNNIEGHGHNLSISPHVCPGRKMTNQTKGPHTDDKPCPCQLMNTEKAGFKGSKYPGRKRKKNSRTPQDYYMPSLGNRSPRKKRTPKMIRTRAKKKSYPSDTSLNGSEIPASPQEEKCFRARRAQREKERKRAEEWRTERHNHCVTCRASECCRRHPAYCNIGYQDNPCCPSIIPQRCNRFELTQYPSAYRCHCYQTCYDYNLPTMCTRCCESHRIMGGEDSGGVDFIPGRNRDVQHSLSSRK